MPKGGCWAWAMCYADGAAGRRCLLFRMPAIDGKLAIGALELAGG